MSLSEFNCIKSLNKVLGGYEGRYKLKKAEKLRLAFWGEIMYEERLEKSRGNHPLIHLEVIVKNIYYNYVICKYLSLM